MPWNKNAALAFIPFVMFGLVFGIGYVGISMVHDSRSYAVEIVNAINFRI